MKKFSSLIVIIMVALSTSVKSNVNINNITSAYNGWKIYGQAVWTENLKTDETVSITPDVNNDGKVDSQDVLKVYDYMKNSTEAPTASTLEDINHDGKVDSQDILAIYDYMKNSTDDSKQADTHEYVDLGLPSGTLWATCNIGANKPEEFGLHFAWGETTEKSLFTWENYKWGMKNNITKYCTDSYYGTEDDKTILDSCDDAATKNWGEAWRMPTKAEWEELSTKCTKNFTTLNGVKGMKVEGPNGNSIFLPAAGYYDGSGVVSLVGHYWSSSLESQNTYAYKYTFYIVAGTIPRLDWVWRNCGLSVRPVRVQN